MNGPGRILLSLAIGCGWVSASPARPPNVVLIMADDAGWECFGAYGAEDYATPNLDALASKGIRFDHCYATPICTPSRVEIMTGQYSFRNYTHFGYLRPKDRTFGHLMKDAGYATAVAGKWQLNGLYHKAELVHDRFVPTPDTIGAAPRTRAANKAPKGRAARKENFVAMVNYLDKLVGKIVQKVEEIGQLDFTDFYTTLAEAAGVQLREGDPIDGFNGCSTTLRPRLRSKAGTRRNSGPSIPTGRTSWIRTIDLSRKGFAGTGKGRTTCIYARC